MTRPMRPESIAYLRRIRERHAEQRRQSKQFSAWVFSLCVLAIFVMWAVGR